MTNEFEKEMEPTNKKVKIDPDLKKCSVPFCSTRALSRFSRIPANEAKKQEWLKILEIPNILTPNSRVCHRHFHERDFINSKNRKRLKTNAIPSVKLKKEFLESTEVDSVIIKQEISEQINFQGVVNNFEIDPLLSDEKFSMDTDSITIKEEHLETKSEMVESPSILGADSLFDTDSITIKEDPLDTNLMEDNFVAITQKSSEKINHEKQEISWEDKVSNVSLIRKYECGHCEKSFDLLTPLKRHIILEHQVEKIYDCEICCAIFTNGEALRDHIMSVHEEKKLFPCNFCNFKAAKYINWKAHLLLAHEKNVFKCDICCIRFAQEYDLISHMKKTHEVALKRGKTKSEKSGFKCDNCFLMFVREIDLKSHINKAHEKTMALKTEKSYTCNHCFVCFKDKLAKHDKFCKGKKFQCTLCSGSYQTEYHLETHISIKHPNSLETSPIRIEDELIDKTSESITNKCLSCDAQFSTKIALENHVSTYHKNQVLKECPCCNAYFSSQMNQVTINRHINKCIKECRVAKDKEFAEEFANSQKSSIPSTSKVKIKLQEEILESKSFKDYISQIDPLEAPTENKVSVNCPSLDFGYQTIEKEEFEKHIAIGYKGNIIVNKDSVGKQTHKKWNGEPPSVLHSKIVHEVKKPQESYTCNHCFVCFKDKDKLVKHDKVCKDKKFQCTLCSCSYQIEYHLERHFSLKHSLETSPIRNQD